MKQLVLRVYCSFWFRLFVAMVAGMLAGKLLFIVGSAGINPLVIGSALVALLSAASFALGWYYARNYNEARIGIYTQTPVALTVLVILISAAALAYMLVRLGDGATYIGMLPMMGILSLNFLAGASAQMQRSAIMELADALAAICL